MLEPQSECANAQANNDGQRLYAYNFSFGIGVIHGRFDFNPAAPLKPYPDRTGQLLPPLLN
jgi:hypothetical protein